MWAHLDQYLPQKNMWHPPPDEVCSLAEHLLLWERPWSVSEAKNNRLEKLLKEVALPWLTIEIHLGYCKTTSSTNLSINKKTFHIFWFISVNLSLCPGVSCFTSCCTTFFFQPRHEGSFQIRIFAFQWLVGHFRCAFFAGSVRLPSLGPWAT